MEVEVKKVPERHSRDCPIMKTVWTAQTWNHHHKATNGYVVSMGGDALSVHKATWVHRWA